MQERKLVFWASHTQDSGSYFPSLLSQENKRSWGRNEENTPYERSLHDDGDGLIQARLTDQKRRWAASAQNREYGKEWRWEWSNESVKDADVHKSIGCSYYYCEQMFRCDNHKDVTRIWIHFKIQSLNSHAMMIMMIMPSHQLIFWLILSAGPYTTTLPFHVRDQSDHHHAKHLLNDSSSSPSVFLLFIYHLLMI